MLSLVQRNSVPSLQMRCMITASRRAERDDGLLRPRRLATFIGPGLQPRPFLHPGQQHLSCLIEQRSHHAVAAQRDAADRDGFRRTD